MSTKIKEKERKRIIRKIDLEINNCEIEDRIHILNMICAKTGKNVLYETGESTGIMFNVIDDDLLREIDIFISLAIEKTKLNLDSDPED